MASDISKEILFTNPLFLPFTSYRQVFTPCSPCCLENLHLAWHLTLELHIYNVITHLQCLSPLLDFPVYFLPHVCRAVSRRLAYSKYLINASIDSNSGNHTSQHMVGNRRETIGTHWPISTWLKPAVDSRGTQGETHSLPLQPPPLTQRPSPSPPLSPLPFSVHFLGSRGAPHLLLPRCPRLFPTSGSPRSHSHSLNPPQIPALTQIPVQRAHPCSPSWSGSLSHPIPGTDKPTLMNHSLPDIDHTLRPSLKFSVCC